MPSTKIFLAIIIFVGCATQIASDIYTPSIPAIAQALNTPINHAQWSMPIYMFGIALTQLIYGPVSEGIGRRAPLIFGLILFFIGSIVCVATPSIEVLLLGRFIQGLGAGACAALWRSMFRDAFEGEQLAKYTSYLIMFISFVLPAAPAVGGIIQETLGWRANFGFITLYIIITLFLVITQLHETSKHHHKERLKKSYIISTYKQLLTSRIFMGYTFCVFLTYGAYFATFVVGPVLIIHVIGLSPMEFGWLSLLVSSLGLFLGGIINSRCVPRYGVTTMLRVGWGLTALSGLLMLLGNFIFGINAYVIMIPLFLFIFGGIFIWPNVFAGAFQPFGNIAGYAGSLYSFMQMGGGAVVGALVSHLPDHNQIPLALVLLILPLLAWAVFEFVVRPAELQTCLEKQP